MRGFIKRYVLALVGALAACGTGGQSSSVDPSTRAYVEVQNSSSNDMTIFVVRGGVRTNLGSVKQGSTATLELPGGLAILGVPMRFRAEPSNPTGFSWEPYVEDISVGPGRTARFNIPPG